jgi:hypothetical protein
VGENRWYQLGIPVLAGRRTADRVGQNRAWTYDPRHNLVFMVLGASAGDRGATEVFGLRYSHNGATLAK